MPVYVKSVRLFGIHPWLTTKGSLKSNSVTYGATSKRVRITKETTQREWMKSYEGGNAEEVPAGGTPGEQRYILHVTLKNLTNYVLFDSSAKYCGTILNKHLLPGPDMLSNRHSYQIQTASYCPSI